MVRSFESEDQLGFEGLGEGIEVVFPLSIIFSNLRSQLDRLKNKKE